MSSEPAGLCVALRAAFRYSPSGVMITDNENRIVAVNRAFERLTGYFENEVLGQKPSLLRSGLHDAGFYKAMWDGLTARGVWAGEVWDRRKDGTKYPIWLSIDTVRDEVTNTVAYFVACFNDLSRSKIAEERIRQLAYHDPLTGLANRVLLKDRLERALAIARRRQGGLALIFVDLDRFKNINDSLGHAAGDQMLKEVGARLTGCVRSSDTVSRIGGDEFVILLDDLAHEDNVIAIVGKILKVFDQPIAVDKHMLRAAAGIGIAMYPKDGGDPDVLMQNADTAMHQAKSAGSSKFQFFAPYMNARVRERLELENMLHEALQQEEFELHYQPIMDLRSGRVASVEALIRWRRGVGVLVPPGKFIPLAEETGFIVQIGEWVLRKVCSDLAAWPANGRDMPTVSVNISSRQFRQSGLADQIRCALKDYGIDASRLELELTEGALMDHPEHAVEILCELKAMGLGLAIDDFGSGYSSLAYLKTFPIDKLKIDQSFVRDILIDERDREITCAVIALSHNLGLKVVAEGVENQAQLDFIESKRCDFVQGYFYSEPIPLDALVAYCRAVDVVEHGRGNNSG